MQQHPFVTVSIALVEAVYRHVGAGMEERDIRALLDRDVAVRNSSENLSDKSIGTEAIAINTHNEHLLDTIACTYDMTRTPLDGRVPVTGPIDLAAARAKAPCARLPIASTAQIFESLGASRY